MLLLLLKRAVWYGMRPWGGIRADRIGGLSIPVLSWAGAMLVAERDRWVLWFPVLFGGGIALYFLMPAEPPAALSFALVAGAGILVLGVWRAAPPWLPLVLPLLAAALGMLRADWEADRVAAPVLTRDVYVPDLSGRVAGLEPLVDGARVRLEDLDFGGRLRGAAPHAVRVKLRRGDLPAVGSRVSLAARLAPPPWPAYPGAYDFARRAWFDRLGGVGFALSETRLIARDGSAGLVARAQAELLALRLAIAARLRAAAPGREGAVAAALLVGERSGVPEAVTDSLRASGLAHLLAISGLHIGLVAALMFFGLRFGMTRIEPLALKHPVKKYAAGGALLAAFLYLMLSGATVPTQRAFLMTGLVLVAVMADRKAISMRLVALAAAAVLLLDPDSLMGASFQLSFAATTALVAVYEAYRPRFERAEGEPPSGWRRLAGYVAAVALTTVVANAATAPFAIFHFGRLADYGLLANLVAIPVMSFWVMPAGLITLLAMPFGLEQPFLALMTSGIEIVLWTAERVAALPGSVRHIPEMPGWGMAAIVCGGLWLAVWQRRWRWLGAGPVLLGLLSPLSVAPPVAILSDSGRQAAVVTPEGLWLLSDRRERFATSVWSEKIGSRPAGTWRDLAEAPLGPMRCGALGCVFAHDGITVALSRDPRTLPEDCRRADVVVADIFLPPWLCRGTASRTPIRVDPVTLHRQGTHLIRAGPTGARLETVAERRGERPWSGGR